MVNRLRAELDGLPADIEIACQPCGYRMGPNSCKAVVFDLWEEMNGLERDCKWSPRHR